MKSLKVSIVILFLLIARNSIAQVSVTVGVPPLWGPVGYTGVEYYYLPDVEAYYDVNTGMFIYYNGWVWTHSPNLPGPYANYDLYHGYKVVMDYHGPAPYAHFNEDRRRYYKGYHGPAQRTYREEREGRNIHPDNRGHEARPEEHREAPHREVPHEEHKEEHKEPHR